MTDAERKELIRLLQWLLRELESDTPPNVDPFRHCSELRGKSIAVVSSALVTLSG